jgi:hypothetical protein
LAEVVYRGGPGPLVPEFRIGAAFRADIFHRGPA